MPCHELAKGIELDIPDVITEGFLGIVKCVVDPKVEVKKLLHDPEKSNGEKVVGIVGVGACVFLGQVVGDLGRNASRSASSAVSCALGASQYCDTTK